MLSISGLNFKPKRLGFIVLCLSNFCISFHFAALASVLPTMSSDLGVSTSSAAWLLPTYMIPYGVGALLSLILLQRYSFSIIIGVSLIVYAASNLICVFTQSLSILLAARIFMGITAASVIPLTLIFIGSNFRKEIRGRLIGLFFSISFFSSVVGLLFSGFFHWRWLFVVPVGLALGVSLLSLVWPNKKLSVNKGTGLSYWNVLKEVSVQRIFLFIFLISFLYHGVHKWLGVYLASIYHLNQATISFYFILIALCGALGQNAGGWVTDKKGRLTAAFLGIGMMTMATMSLVGVFPLIVLGIILSLFSIGWTVSHNSISTLLTDFPDHYRNEMAGLNSAVRFVSGGLGFVCGGPWVEKYITLVFLGFGFLMGMSMFFLKPIMADQVIDNFKRGKLL